MESKSQISGIDHVQTLKHFDDYNVGDFIDFISKTALQEDKKGFCLITTLAGYRALKEVIPMAIATGEIPGLAIVVTPHNFPELRIDFQS